MAGEHSRIIVWFSCGAASAVAAKVTVDAYAKRFPVEVVNIDMSQDEHPDNERFLLDVQGWIGQKIIRLKSEKYQSIDEVFLKERYIAGVMGAACTKRMKRAVQDKYVRSDDTKVLGMTADERPRIDRITTRYPDERFLWVLADCGITKDECFGILSAANIKLPAMYHLGYDHNNCIGCVKGGAGYWNKIRRDFPAVFKRRAEIERDIGASILKDVYLDELDPEAGRDVKQPNIECGLFCEGNNELLQLAINSNHR